MNKGLGIFVAAGLAATLATIGHAEELTGTLKNVKDSGTISIGHRETSIPFSYYDNDQKVVGYSQDIALQLVDAVKAHLGMAELNVNLVPVTSQTRIPLLINNTIDLECGTTTNNKERQKQIGFSTNFFIIGTRLLTRNGSGISDFPDLAGKNVVVSAGTTSEKVLRQMNEAKGMDMRIISAKDHGEAFVTLESNKAVAFMSDDAILYGEISKAKNPADWHITGTAQTNEVYACGMRKDDPAFKKVIDDQMAEMMKSGEMAKIYDKWFNAPIPPRDVVLGVPLGEEMKKLYAEPNDIPLQ
ncbi:glutamate/aspartate ABC transporter substrate-binding protein [Aminobacter sp. BE322]|uniref:glutamate/aspartate ABC transporter substrate-binding protein n=1 Tax=unclassified Aminobacter TaxID=2644704 RepID=UPI003D260A5D